MTKWKPKDDLIGVPGKGYIKSENFTEEDLQNLIARANNRKKDVHTFLLGCGLVPGVPPQLNLDLDESPKILKTEVVKAKSDKKGKKAKAE
jgi:hypothetical protein